LFHAGFDDHGALRLGRDCLIRRGLFDLHRGVTFDG
jgi:hypothetical protein